jgi:hypothetical protein
MILWVRIRSDYFLLVLQLSISSIKQMKREEDNHVVESQLSRLQVVSFAFQEQTDSVESHSLATLSKHLQTFMSKARTLWSGKIVYTTYNRYQELHDIIIYDVFYATTIVIHTFSLVNKIIQWNTEHIIVSLDPDEVKIWNVNTGECVQTYKDSAAGFAMKNGDFVIMHRPVINDNYNNYITIYNGKLDFIKEIKCHSQVASVLELQDGTLLYCDGNNFHIVDNHLNEVKSIQLDNESIWTLSEISYGIVRSFDYNHISCTWNIRTGKLLKKETGIHAACAIALQIGLHVIVSDSMELGVFDHTGAQVSSIKDVYDERCQSITEVEPGVILCQYEDHLAMWDVLAGRKVQQYAIPVPHVDTWYLQCVLFNK